MSDLGFVASMPVSLPRGSEATVDRRGFVRASIGTEAERRRSAHIASVLLLSVSVCAVAGVITAARTGVLGGLRPNTYLVLFTLLGFLSVASAALEWVRSPVAERFTLATGAVGTALTWFTLINGWWFLAPFLGLATLGVLITAAYRLMVRDEARHATSTHSLFH